MGVSLNLLSLIMWDYKNKFQKIVMRTNERVYQQKKEGINYQILSKDMKLSSEVVPRLGHSKRSVVRWRKIERGQCHQRLLALG